MKANDSTSKVLRSEPWRLATVLGLAVGNDATWSDDELRAFLAQQLAAPLEFEAGAADPGLTTRLASLTQSGEKFPRTFGELLRHSHPAASLLQFAKDYAKAVQKHPAGGVPQEVAMVLYYAAIAAALLRRAQGISRLTNEELRRGFAWAMHLSWIDAEIKALLAAAAQALPPCSA